MGALAGACRFRGCSTLRGVRPIRVIVGAIFSNVGSNRSRVMPVVFSQTDEVPAYVPELVPEPVAELVKENGGGGGRGGPIRKSYPFTAELNLTELDGRDRVGTSWSAVARELGRSHISIVSRRMCYVDRRILIAVHLIDGEPVPLCGIVRACEYLGEGLHRVDLDLMPLPDDLDAKPWLDTLTSR